MRGHKGRNCKKPIMFGLRPRFYGFRTSFSVIRIYAGGYKFTLWRIAPDSIFPSVAP